MLDADITRLAQVVLNLINNAAKYTEPGGRIDLRATLDDTGVVTISVRDTGIGIPAAKLATIFEMFSQVEGALSRSQGGLGIGLYLVKRLVEMHEGTIEAHSGGPNTAASSSSDCPWPRTSRRQQRGSPDAARHGASFGYHRTLRRLSRSARAELRRQLFRGLSHD